MTVRGRKPKPTFLKVIEGNPGKRAINHDEPEPEGDIGAPLEWMTDREKEIWLEAAANAPEGMLKSLDASVFVAWVGHRSVWEHAKQQVSRFGSLMRNPNGGGPSANPYLRVMNEQAVLMMRAAEQLGFSPTSRTRVKVDKGKKRSAFNDLRSLNELD